MATSEQIAELRRLINESTTEVYSDGMLGTLIDSLGVNTAARNLWREKTARYADLVNVTEGNSKREMSTLHKHALDMVTYFDTVVSADVVAVTRRAGTRAIERP